ncbi:MAG: ubiquinol-cytochrome c reductase iron-sulfur subunit [Candidatus Dormibacteria bacterium]
MALNPYDSPRGRLHTRAEVTRRQFLGIMGAIGGVGALVFGGIESIKFLFPGATLEDPPEFKVQQEAATIIPGQVVQITEKRISIVRDDKGFYCVYLICTHLGCTPNYVSDVVSGSGVPPTLAADKGARSGAAKIPNGWACPCHGSRYYIDSTNFYGPAPRPMDWVHVQFSPDGKLVVDRSKLVAYRQAGDQTPPQWRLDPETKKDNGMTLGT